VEGDYDTAIAECTRAIELDPNYLSAHHDLAGALYMKAVASAGEPDEAERLHAFLTQLQRVLALDGEPAAGSLPPSAVDALMGFGNWAIARAEELTGDPTA
jgi:tetratricopeptide (TPR) repeat protein